MSGAATASCKSTGKARSSCSLCAALTSCSNGTGARTASTHTAADAALTRRAHPPAYNTEEAQLLDDLEYYTGIKYDSDPGNVSQHVEQFHLSVATARDQCHGVARDAPCSRAALQALQRSRGAARLAPSAAEASALRRSTTQAPDPPNLQMMLANGWALKPDGVVEKPNPRNPNYSPVLMISFDDSVRAINVKRHVERAIFWGT